VGEDQLEPAPQDRAALLRPASPATSRKGGTGGLDRTPGFAHPQIGNAAQAGPGRGVEHGQRRPAVGRHPRAIDIAALAQQAGIGQLKAGESQVVHESPSKIFGNGLRVAALVPRSPASARAF